MKASIKIKSDSTSIYKVLDKLNISVNSKSILDESKILLNIDTSESNIQKIRNEGYIILVEMNESDKLNVIDNALGKLITKTINSDL